MVRMYAVIALDCFVELWSPPVHAHKRRGHNLGAHSTVSHINLIAESITDFDNITAFAGTFDSAI